MKGKRLAVVVSDACRGQSAEVERAVGRFGRVIDAPALDVRALVAQVANDGYDVVGALGSDSHTARIGQAICELGVSLPLLPLGCGTASALVADLSIKGFPAAVAARFASLAAKGSSPGRGGGPRELRRRLLRIVDSRVAAAIPAFSVGIGRLLPEATGSTSRAAAAARVARWLVEDLKPGGASTRDVRICVDGALLEQGTLLAMASTLRTFPHPFGGRSGSVTDQEHFNVLWVGAGFARSVMAMAALGAGRLAGALQLAHARRMDMDLEVPATVDGVLEPSSEAYALSVRPGPVVELLAI
jgi:hypothetical protein